MPPKCAIASCLNNGRRVKKYGVMFHRFPLKNEILVEEWVKRCRREGVVNPKTARICSVHFKSDDYEDDMKNRLLGLPLVKRLKPTAVPNLHLPTQMNLRALSVARKERYHKRKKKLLHVEECVEKLIETSVPSSDEDCIIIEESKTHGCEDCLKLENRILKLEKIIKRLKPKVKLLSERKKKNSKLNKRKKKLLKSLKKKTEVIESEPDSKFGLDPEMMSYVTQSDMMYEMDSTTLITPDIEPPDSPTPGLSSRMEPDSSMTEQEVILALTCEGQILFPNPDYPQSVIVTNIKEEQPDTEESTRDILSAGVEEELTSASKGSSVVTSSRMVSLLKPPIRIKEEPVEFEE